MIDQERLTIVSRAALANNLRVLQGFRLAATDEAHISKLLEYMDPKPNTTWADIGCGFGEPARIMQELRPDLEFLLVNNNSFQLAQVPDTLAAYCCDMHELPFPSGSLDGAMFLYSLCHADNFVAALKEAARVVRTDGRLFVFDYVRGEDSSDTLSWHYLDARFIRNIALRALTRASGWRFDGYSFPEGDDAVFRSLFGDERLYDEIFYDVTPVVWWATRR